jgi:hypothetical protein
MNSKTVKDLLGGLWFLQPVKYALAHFALMIGQSASIGSKTRIRVAPQFRRSFFGQKRANYVS